jgi:hypothetical protein
LHSALKTNQQTPKALAQGAERKTFFKPYQTTCCDQADQILSTSSVQYCSTATCANATSAKTLKTVLSHGATQLQSERRYQFNPNATP